jgi:hypothetical protein
MEERHAMTEELALIYICSQETMKILNQNVTIYGIWLRSNGKQLL